MVAKRARNMPLDVLRALAVIFVYGAHITTPLPRNWTRGFAIYWTSYGRAGVDLFFVLSGFLISGLLIDEFVARKDVDVRRFLIRRAFKLYPAYYIFLAYLILMPTAKAVLVGHGAASTFAVGCKQMLPNFFFVQNYIYDTAYTPMHTWSLAVEEHFYLVIPFLLVFLMRRNRVRWLFALALLGEGFSKWCMFHGSGPFATHVCFSELLAGVCLRSSWHLSPSFRDFCGSVAWPLTLAGVLLIAVPTPLKTITVEGGGVLVIAGAIHLNRDSFPRSARVLEFVPRTLAWIGFYSYSIYLWHVTTGRIADKFLTGRFLGSFGWFPCMTASMIVAILAGILLSKLIEYPMLKLRDRIWPSRVVVINKTATP